VKSLKAGSNFTLKKGIFCPDNGEGLTEYEIRQGGSSQISGDKVIVEYMYNNGFDYDIMGIDVLNIGPWEPRKERCPLCKRE